MFFFEETGGVAPYWLKYINNRIKKECVSNRIHETRKGHKEY